MIRLFHSSWVKDAGNENSGLGLAWRHNHNSFLRKVSENILHVDLPGGERNVFVRDTFGQDPGPWRLLSGNNSFTFAGDEFELRRASDGVVFLFKSGLLDSVTERSGLKVQYTYNASKQLVLVRNHFGRTLEFTYDGSGRLVSVLPSDGVPIGYSFDASGRLQNVTYGDGVNRSYHYENSLNANLLTGVSIQGQRFSTFAYDQNGLVVSTEHAGGVNKYTVSYPSLGSSATVVDPLGQSRTYNYSSKGGYFAVIGSNWHSATSNSQAYTRVQNDLGLIEREGDFNSVYTTYQWDTARRLPLSVTEASGRPEARTTTTTWHADLPLPASVSSPGRTISYTYDNAGNRLTRSIAEANSGGSARTTTWTYNAAGLVATETAPNGGVTSYTYDALGNVTQSTNAVGHVSAFTYDIGGRVLTYAAPNGLVTAYAYDARGRMLSRSSAGQLTTLTYSPGGQVLTATLPHGQIITYSYDAAQRLTGWSDNRGSTGSYVLDNMGNRISEEVRGGQGQLVWQLARTINSLNRVTSTSAAGQSVSYKYDYNGDLSSETNGLNETTSQGLDALRRVKSITNAENATASLTYNALDSVTSVTDPKSVATTYTRDALGNATSESSPDSGSESTQYDALGLPSSITNALGQATTITRDLLGRPTSIVHTGGTTTLRYDQTPASKGYLSEIEDASGTTTYQRDVHGRVVSQTQKLINNDTRTLAYSYHPTTGLLSSTTYPGGQVLQNVYDATGQLTGLTWAGQPLVSGITWSPLGQPTGWSWNLPGGAAAIPATRSYNTAGQLTATEFSSYTYDAAGRITSLTQSLMQPASTDAQANTVVAAPATWTVTYNRAGRITGFTKQVAAGNAANTVTYTYDANGNRLTSSQQRAGTTTNRTYTLTANRQTGFSQTQSGASTANTSVTYQYNAAGDLLNDGLRSFQYDSQERLEKVTTGTGADAPSTQYAHNALGQRVFKTEPLFASGSGSGSTSSGKNLNNLLADPEDQEEAEKEKEQDKGFIQTAYEFFTRLWSPGSSDAQKLGFAYVYGQDGTLLGEYGMGGSNSSGTTQYIYLPTANGPMPIAAIVNGVAYAVHSDHLNTPRKLTQPDGQVAWQWAYSAFGDEQPTLGSKRFTDVTTNPTTGTTTIPEVTFNLRYPGQYYDKESNLHYNYFRSYSAERGRYTQADPIGLEGGFNRFGYVGGDPLSFTDPLGLETYICKRPLGGEPGSYAPPLLNHTYVCVGSGDNMICGSTTASSGGALSNIFGGSSGRPTTSVTDYYKPEACERRQGQDSCIETCVANELKKPTRPKYGVGPSGTDCQEYTEDVVSTCERRCVRR
jgi:RHS repeat-associated protein